MIAITSRFRNYHDAALACSHCGGCVGAGSEGLPPPPKIFWNIFFFLGGFCSEGAGDCGLPGVTGVLLEFWAPLENNPCIVVCGDSPM
jgi:hypothetical protein